jgi:uncharacterized protein YfbU (UPF0304 family)
MEEFTKAHSNETLTNSPLIEKIQHAEEEITKDGEPFKVNKLTYLTLNKKLLKPFTRPLLNLYDDLASVHDIQVVLNDGKFIKYIQINFLEYDADVDSKYKPYIRFYREKTFHTEKKPNTKGDFPKMINVSKERKDLPVEMETLKTHLFKLIYKMIFNANPDKGGDKDGFKRRIKFL